MMKTAAKRSQKRILDEKIKTDKERKRILLVKAMGWESDLKKLIKEAQVEGKKKK